MLESRKELYWQKALEISNTAKKSNKLVPIDTKIKYHKEVNNINFEIRTITNSRLKFPLKRSYGPVRNPFSPWEKELEISKINNSHILLLNKFPVQIGHMLLITKSMNPQDEWLTINDWDSMKTVDNDTSGLWFFNSCARAGASQTHRHMQLLRRDKVSSVCPLQSWYSSSSNDNIPNKYLRSNIASEKRKPLYEDALALYKSYINLCDKLDIGDPVIDKKPKYPYNMLISPDWISIVKRTKEYARGYSLNALAFGGYILSTKQSDSEWLKVNGPIKLLEEVVT